MIVSALTLLALALPATDRIQLISGQTLMGDVKQAGVEGIVVATADGEERRLDPSQVLHIEYGGLPDLYLRGVAFVDAMDYQNAVSAFEGAVAETGSPHTPELAKLARAEALLAWAKIDKSRASEAESAFRDWLASYPDSFHQVRSRTGLGQALAVGGDPDGGAKELEELSSLAFEKNLGRHVEYGARLARCEVYLQGGQSAVAETRLRDLVPNILNALSDPDTERGVRPALRRILSRAQIDLGDAIQEKGGSAAAKTYWDGLLRDARVSLDVRAAAMVGVAQDALENGRAREAQMQLSLVVATLETSAEVKARALFRLGEACRALQDDVAPARPYWEQVVKDHPQTRWAAEARAALGS